MSKVCASRVPLIGYEGRKETMAAIEECGLQLMDHPLFSSDLAPSYFFIPLNEEAIERPPLSSQRWYLCRHRGVALTSTTPHLL